MSHYTSLHLNQPQTTLFDPTYPHSITLHRIFSHLTLPYLNRHQLASLKVMRIQWTSLDQNWYQMIPINFRWPQIIISTSILYPHKSQLTAFDLIYLILPLSDSIDLIIVNWLQLTSPITVSHLVDSQLFPLNVLWLFEWVWMYLEISWERGFVRSFGCCILEEGVAGWSGILGWPLCGCHICNI